MTPTIIVDAHLDIAYNAILYGRDYRLSAHEKRRHEARNQPMPVGTATIGLPDAIHGRVAVVFATIFVEPFKGKDPRWAKLAYRTPAEAYRLGMMQADYYERLADEEPRIILIRTQADLESVLTTWEKGRKQRERKHGFVLLMENAEPIREPKQFEEWYERGVRIVGPAWESTRYTAGTDADGPLTALGRELLGVMADLNAILDLSHIAEKAFFEALDLYEGVVIASHSNPRRFCNTHRHLSDTMILRLAERDGVMGINWYNRFLSNTWKKGDRKAEIGYHVPIDAIDYVCQLTGSAAHVGIGTDMDGGFGAESIPEGYDTQADLWTVGDALRRRGYSEADIQAILGGNMLRKLRQTLPER